MHIKILPWIHLLAVIIAFLSVAEPARADPIKLQPFQVTASSTAAGSNPSFATDGSSSTLWNAGNFPTQWIQIDLGRTTSIRKIRLQVAQSPSGQTNHVISAGQEPTALKTITAFSGVTSDGQWLEYSLGNTNLGNVRYLRITTTQSPSWVAWKEIELYQGVEFVTWYGDAYDWVGNGDYIAETTALGANMVWIGGGTTANFGARLREASNAGAKAMLLLSPQLFDGTTLRSDWQSRWAEVAAIVRAAPPRTVAAFYPYDEPYLAGVRKEDLSTVVARIHLDFPGIAVAVILSSTELDRGLGASYVSAFDWVGFDCYASWAVCNMPSRIATLRSWLAPSQRMLAVPWAFRYQTDVDRFKQDEVVRVISQWQAEVTSNAAYVAVVPFLWQTADIGASTLAVGTRDLPQIKERLYELTRTFLRFSPSALYAADYAASGSYGDALPFFAFNRSTTDVWNAGTPPTAWVEANLGGSTRIGRLDLTVAQSPAGATTHVLDGLTPAGSWIRLGTLQGSTSEGQRLSWTGSADVSKVRVTTTQSPSWVAWHEIQISR